ncbi:MAG: hypothetical protein WA004_03250 [Saprospiraceae bacterium]
MKNIILFLALITFAACQESHTGHAAAVELDNGKRWQANPETTAGIAKMQTILANYEGRNTPEDRKAMREELEAAFQDIFAQCTMKGEAHDQLHNYLFPMKDLFGRIESSDEAVGELKAHLGEYGGYFE